VWPSADRWAHYDALGLGDDLSGSESDREALREVLVGVRAPVPPRSIEVSAAMIGASCSSSPEKDSPTREKWLSAPAARPSTRSDDERIALIPRS
jgi:hypothetical protein